MSYIFSVIVPTYIGLRLGTCFLLTISSSSVVLELSDRSYYMFFLLFCLFVCPFPLPICSSVSLSTFLFLSIYIPPSLYLHYSFSLSTHLCMSILKITHVSSSLPTFLYLSLSTTVFVSLSVSLLCSSCQYFWSKVFSRILCSKH